MRSEHDCASDEVPVRARARYRIPPIWEVRDVIVRCKSWVRQHKGGGDGCAEFR